MTHNLLKITLGLYDASIFGFFGKTKGTRLISHVRFLMRQTHVCLNVAGQAFGQAYHPLLGI